MLLSINMGFWEHLWYTASIGSTCKCVYIFLECSQMLMHFLPVCDWGTMRLTLLGAPTHKTWPDHSMVTPWTLCPTLIKIYEARLASKFCCSQSVDHEGLGESHTGIRQMQDLVFKFRFKSNEWLIFETEFYLQEAAGNVVQFLYLMQHLANFYC